MLEGYAGAVHVRPFPHMLAGASFLVAIIQMRFCSGVSFHRFLGFASFFVRSLFIKFSMPDVSAPWHEWLAGNTTALLVRTGSSSAEQIFRARSARSVQRFGFLCASMGSVNSGGERGVVASRTWGGGISLRIVARLSWQACRSG